MIGKLNKKWLIILICIGVIFGVYLLFVSSSFQMTKSISMGGMIIEEKHHYVQSGEYFEMWIIGYNAYEEEGNRERYKIYIEESMVYNLIEEGKKYMVSAQSFREDEEYGYVYELIQISNQEAYQLAGKGRIK